MARQTGPFTFTGKLGGLVFYTTKNGAFVRTKSSLNKERFLSDPAFARSRENSDEFKLAVKASKLIRQSLANLNAKVDSKSHLRLNALMRSLAELDLENTRGNRNVGSVQSHPEFLTRLNGFEFNISNTLDMLFREKPDIFVSQNEIIIEDLIPDLHLNFPVEANYAEFSMQTVKADLAALAHQHWVSQRLFVSLDHSMNRIHLETSPDNPPSGLYFNTLFVRFLTSLSNKRGNYDQGDCLVITATWYNAAN